MSNDGCLPGSDITYTIPVVAVDDTRKCQCKSSRCKNHCSEEQPWWGNKTVLVTAQLNTTTAATHVFHVLGSCDTKQHTLVGSDTKL